MFKNIFDYMYVQIYCNKVPDIIIYILNKNFSKFLPIKDLHNIKNTTKELYNNKYLNKEIKSQRIILDNSLKFWYIHSKILKYFKNSFFPKHLIRLLPVLEWKKHYMGCTDYIDRITETDLKYPIMIGIDHFRRPFISVVWIVLT